MEGENSRRKSSMNGKISDRRGASRLANGSSINNIRGDAKRARPIATRWRSPPDKELGRRFSNGANANRSMTASKLTVSCRRP